MRERKRSWPAVSQSCRRTVRSSRYMVLERKSMPIVAWYMLSNESYINRVIREVLPTAKMSCISMKHSTSGGLQSYHFARPEIPI